MWGRKWLGWAGQRGGGPNISPMRPGCNNGLLALALGAAYVLYLCYVFAQLLFPAYFLNESKASVQYFPAWQSPYELEFDVGLVCLGPRGEATAPLIRATAAETSLSQALIAATPESSAKILQDYNVPLELLRLIEANHTCETRFSVRNRRSVDPRPVEARVEVVEFRSQQSEVAKQSKRFLLTDFAMFRPYYFIESPSLDVPTGGYWLTDVVFYVVDDATVWTDAAGGTPSIVISNLRAAKHQSESKITYLPLTSKIQQGVSRSTSYVRINTTSAARLPLNVRVRPVSLAKWLMLTQMEVGLTFHEKHGTLDHSDIEDLRKLIAETSPAVLALTMVVASAHLLLDAAAFRAEINFWRKLDSSRGLSLLSLWASTIGQFIVALYLYDADSSILVLWPAVFGCGVQVWKTLKSTRLSGQQSPQRDAAIEATQLQSESLALYYMSLVLVPLVLGYAGWSLVYEEHKGWSSWILSSLALSVYAFGFALMTPQVFLNYELKSVDHMDWMALTLRAFNTFIDDFFALLIPMPNMHRVAVLRDDVVFLIFLYQRQIYKTRKEPVPPGLKEE